MPANAPAGTPRARIVGIATALMCALAGGAVWCLLSLYSRGNLAAFAFAIAAVVAWTLRANGHAGRWPGAVFAAGCVLLAAAYAFYLQAVAGVASMLGLPMRATLQQMGFAMGLDVARANLDGWSSLLVIAASGLAIWLVLRNGRKADA
jgi:hypothetical protein